MRSLSKSIRVLSFAIPFLLASLPMSGQTVTGRILGTVTDSSGAAIRGAAVTITDTQRGTTRNLTSDDSGAYVAPNLLPGTYKVRAESKGFKTVERINIPLEVAQDVAIDLVLPPGQANETIVVTEDIPLVNTTTSTLGGTLSNKEINELPLNGRNYENLLQLRPGVVRYPGGGFSTTSSNGLRAEDNAYLIDGLFNSEPFSGQSIINGAGIAGDSATILPIDSIQEFNVQQNPPAEYGWKPGTIVNVGLKSGTNGLHGTAYAFGRDTPMDARNYFNCDSVATCPPGVTPGPKNPRNLEQFGGSVGGPIIKDRAFFFGSYEGQRYSVGNTFINGSPATVSLGDPSMSVPDAIASVQAAGLPVSQVSMNLAGCTLGPPVTCTGKGFLNNTTGTVNNGLPNNVTSDNAVGKVDVHVNDRNSISGLYFFGNNSGTVQDFPWEFQPQWLTQIHTRAQVFGLNWVHVASSRWANEARVGYNRLYQPTFTKDHNVAASTYGIDTGVTNPLFGGLPRITILGFGPQILGGFNWPKVQGPDTRFQVVDHISYTRGNHALRFGGELHRDAFSGGAYAGGRGRIWFGQVDAYAGASPLEDFFAGVPGKAQVLSGDPTRHIHNWGWAGFVQDDWRVTHNLTLNLGLRYELNTVIKEEHNLLGNFVPNVGLVQVGHGLSSPYNGDHNNFAPRFGFAWDVFGSGKTVLRGGTGIIYETVNWEAFLAFNNTLGLPAIPTASSTGVTPGGGTISVGNITFPGSALNYNSGPVFPVGTINCDPTTGGNPCTIMGVNRNFVTPYVYHWNLSLQHSFTPNLVLETAYVGNHGSKLTGIRDVNQVNQSLDDGSEQLGRPYNFSCPAPIGGGAGGPCYPFLGIVYQMANNYRSNYNGLQATLTARNYHGLTAIAGYTYAHALDQVGANWDFGFGSGLPQDSTNPGREYASSDFDMRHRFTLALTYAFPDKKSFAQLLEGWQINSIVSLFSAQPWGPIDTGTDVSHTGEGVDRWDFFGRPSDFKSGPTPIPYFTYDPANPGATPAACISNATAIGALDSLAAFGCYAKGNSVMIPPVMGTFGTMPRNLFRDSGLKNVDFSIAKSFHFGERARAQFRAEFFNVFNHPNFANPYGGQNGYGNNDPSAPGSFNPFAAGFGCGCATPDVAASNPVIGSGGSRAVQLGLKISF